MGKLVCQMALCVLSEHQLILEWWWELGSFALFFSVLSIPAASLSNGQTKIPLAWLVISQFTPKPLSDNSQCWKITQEVKSLTLKKNSICKVYSKMIFRPKINIRILLRNWVQKFKWDILWWFSNTVQCLLLYHHLLIIWRPPEIPTNYSEEFRLPSPSKDSKFHRSD